MSYEGRHHRLSWANYISKYIVLKCRNTVFAGLLLF